MHFNDDGLSSDAEVAHDFYLELVNPTKLRIKTAQVKGYSKKNFIKIFQIQYKNKIFIQGFYINSGKNGAILLGSENVDEATLWEY